MKKSLTRRAPHGARGLKHEFGAMNFNVERRAPHGARGLKQILDYWAGQNIPSRPARGAWIETNYNSNSKPEKSGRAPHGARGLKHYAKHLGESEAKSRPARGAWIETRIGIVILL